MWSEELSSLIFVYVGMLGISMGIRNQTHVLIDFLCSRFSPRMQKIVFTISQIIIFICIIFMGYLGNILYKKKWIFELVSLKISSGWMYLALPLISILMLYLCAAKFMQYVNLIIDIGNTIAKMAVFDGGRIVEVVYDSNLTLERLPEVCRTYTIEKAIVATVIDLSREVLSQLEDMAVPILWLNEKTSLPVENLYETPRTLGYDRMAAV